MNFKILIYFNKKLLGGKLSQANRNKILNSIFPQVYLLGIMRNSSPIHHYHHKVGYLSHQSSILFTGQVEGGKKPFLPFKNK